MSQQDNFYRLFKSNLESYKDSNKDHQQTTSFFPNLQNSEGTQNMNTSNNSNPNSNGNGNSNFFQQTIFDSSINQLQQNTPQQNQQKPIQPIFNFPSNVTENSTNNTNTPEGFDIAQTQSPFSKQSPFSQPSPFQQKSDVNYPPGIHPQSYFNQFARGDGKKIEPIRASPNIKVTGEFQQRMMDKLSKQQQMQVDIFKDQKFFNSNPNNMQSQSLNTLPPQQNQQQNNFQSVSPLQQPVAKPITQIRQPFSPQIMPRNLPTRMKDKNQKRGSIPASKVEEIMNTVETYKINCISLLNEISTKIKKKVDYTMTESPFGKIRVFECLCYLDKEKVGTGKGNSKQAAKTEAAKEGVKTLLSKESYLPERAAIVLSVQKTSGQIISIAQKAQTSPQDSPNLLPNGPDYILTAKDVGGEYTKDILGSPGQNQNQNDADAHLNDSPLYELNVIAKECFIEPNWVISSQPNRDGEFEAELKFDKITAFGKGRRKQDAKREAAAKIIQQIRSNPEFKEKFNPKKRQQRASSMNSDAGKEAKKKKFFESALEAKFFEDLKSQDFHLREEIRRSTQDLDQYMHDLAGKYRLEYMLVSYFHEVYKKISDYTTMSTSLPKQIMIDESRHLADLVQDCQIIPTGAFALDCVNKINPRMDLLLTFKEKDTEIDSQEVLTLFKNCLDSCQDIDHENNLNPLDFDFRIIELKDGSIEGSQKPKYLEITEISKPGRAVLRVFVSNQTKISKSVNGSLVMDKYDFQIVHIKRILQDFDEYSDDQKDFNTALLVLRLWRDDHKLRFLRSEILDMLVASQYSRFRHAGISSIIQNILMILQTEQNMEQFVETIDKFYQYIWNNIDKENKTKLFKAATESLEFLNDTELSNLPIF